MKIDKNTVPTTIFTIVDDLIKAPNMQNVLKRPGPQPKLTDAEIITIALYQEIIGEPKEDHFLRVHRESLQQYFPNINERSRYNRRKKGLMQVVLVIRNSLLVVLNALEKVLVIDSAPISCVGYKRDKSKTDFTNAGFGFCSSKKLYYFGYKFHGLVNLTGVLVEFMLSSASPHDSQALDELCERVSHYAKIILGDKGYSGNKLRDQIKQEFEIILLAPAKKNYKKKIKMPAGFNKARLLVETVFSQLQEQFNLSRNYAKSKLGLFTRIAYKTTAHTVGILINKLLNRPPLALADLAV